VVVCTCVLFVIGSAIEPPASPVDASPDIPPLAAAVKLCHTNGV
jgi:hypothetical protein